MKSNYHVKISVSLPVHIIERLDKITTYKGKSRSKYIRKSIEDRLNSIPSNIDIPIEQLLSMIEGSNEVSNSLRIQTRLEMGWPVQDLTKGLE